MLPPPPSSLDKGMFPIRAAAPDELLLTRSGQHYYPLPSLPGLGSGLNNGSHFPIPSIGPQGLSQVCYFQPKFTLCFFHLFHRRHTNSFARKKIQITMVPLRCPLHI